MEKNISKKQTGVSPVAAAITGAVVGVGVAIAGAIAISNENNQKKIKGAFNKAKGIVTGRVESEKEIIEDKIAEGKDNANKTVKTVKGAGKKIKSIWQK